MTNQDGDLAELFADIARQLQAQDSPAKLRTRIGRVAVDTIDGCDHASISLVRPRGVIQTVGATDEVPVQIDAIQYAVGEGPCLGAIDQHQVFLIDDLAADEQWPAFSHRAAEAANVRSMLSMRLFVAEDTLGALNLYSRKVKGFDEHACAVASVLAAHAAIAMQASGEHDRAEQLGDAVRSNREIGVAMGVLMARGGLTRDEAFAMLRRASQHLNRKLYDVAAEVAETGQVPERRAPKPWTDYRSAGPEA